MAPPGGVVKARQNCWLCPRLFKSIKSRQRCYTVAHPAHRMPGRGTTTNRNVGVETGAPNDAAEAEIHEGDTVEGLPLVNTTSPGATDPYSAAGASFAPGSERSYPAGSACVPARQTGAGGPVDAATAPCVRQISNDEMSSGVESEIRLLRYPSDRQCNESVTSVAARTRGFTTVSRRRPGRCRAWTPSWRARKDSFRAKR